MQAALKKLEEEHKAAEKAGAANAKELADTLARERGKLDVEKRKAAPYETAYAVAEGPKAGNARIQIKGQPANPGPEVPRRFLEVLGGAALPPDARGSGRRELADWLADPKNPLTARVMVNRIWVGHFGRGIVATPNNFGKQGQRPSHPELLDWLAARFVEDGWSIKAMHRRIMTSRVYRLSGAASEEALRKDPTNELLGRRPRRRLEAEAIRDALLAAAGTLDRAPPEGPHPFPPQEQWDFTQHKPFKDVYETRRRSVYLMTQRIVAHPFLGIFDGPDCNASTERRLSSTTPLQSLYLMNNAFVHEQARAFAERLAREAADEGARIERAYRLAFGRPPAGEERAAAARHLSEARAIAGGGAEGPAWESLARVLFLSNEFIYVD
jgi:hypothetical protein